MKRVRRTSKPKDAVTGAAAAGEQGGAQMPEPRRSLSGSTRLGVAGARFVGRTDGTAKVDVTVVLVRKNDIQREELHRHSLMIPPDRPLVDHAAFADRYGARPESVDAITSLAASHRLTVTNVDALRRVVELSGSVSDMEQAFGTVLHDYAIGTYTYRCRQGPLLMPAETMPHIEAVLGLDNRPVAKPRMMSRDVKASYYPNELATLYQFPPGDGSGQTVALIELGGSYGPQDLQAYFTAAGVGRVPNVRSVSVTPGVPVAYGLDRDGDGEVMLDIEVVGAMAPGADIVVYFTENSDQGFYQAASRAVHDPATTAVSISWGSLERHWTQQSMDAWNSLGQSAVLLNVPMFVAAGDHGCIDEEITDAGYDGQRHADFPGTCASGVVSCGGTSVQSANGAITSETAWNDGNGLATGGGVSIHFPLPGWQNGISADGSTPLIMRGVPDVAGCADPSNGIKVRVNGVEAVSGGTSAVAPQWAALTAVLSQRLGHKAGFFIPLLYANSAAAATNSIVSGNNTVFGVTGFTAKTGWNACTGLGSPNGTRLLSLLSGATPPVAAAAPVPAPPGVIAPPAPVGGAAGLQSRLGSPFDPAAAVAFGRFVQAAYTMYKADPANLTPAPSVDFPAGYELTAWINMRDFIISSTAPVFYGYIAHSTANPNQLVLAIRGTSNGIEWWDDVNAIVKTPFKVLGCGEVGMGFARIYDTLEVVARPAGIAAPAAQSLRSVGGFSRQVATLMQAHAAATVRAPGSAASASIEVTGHSLGSALATLYVLENARTDRAANPAVCTFASPLVGDATFAAAFNGLGLTSWRIVNAPDLVPMLPPDFLGFTHVDTERRFSSIGKVKSSPSCWHALETYLSLIDPTLQPGADCRLAASVAASVAAASPAAATTVSLPAGPVTVNITVNIAGGE